MSEKSKKLISIDTGGTFTDFVYFDGTDISVIKVPSNPENPADAIAEGFHKMGLKNIPIFMIHGTTVATNAILERKGAKILLITNVGFEDILFIGRQNRPELFALQVKRPAPFVERHNIIGVDTENIKKEHLDWGKELIGKMRKKHFDIICICFLYSYEDSSLEKKLKEFLVEKGYSVVTSSEVLPEFREFERFSTTVLNAYVAPRVERYIGELESKLKVKPLQIMQSNGGTISAQNISREAVRTLLSGPAGGVIGAWAVARELGYSHMISFDMGGTSTDVSLLSERPIFTKEAKIKGWPVGIPMLDIHTVGAGGGSIAYIDPGGMLKVGPRSAGANPGPACYGMGNHLTVTDADLFLGKIEPEYFLGGKMKIYPEKAKNILRKMSAVAGKNPMEFAEGITMIVREHMLRALRIISIQRGFDPSDFVMVSFGGAGGMHAAELAHQLGIKKVILPPCAGVLSALGMLMADCIRDYQKAIFAEIPSGNTDYVDKMLAPFFSELLHKGIEDFKTEGFSEDHLMFHPTIDVRFKGQSWEIAIPYRIGRLEEDFFHAHKNHYGYVPMGRDWEVVNVRMQVIGKRKHPDLKSIFHIGASGNAKPRMIKKVFWHNKWRSTPFFYFNEIGSSQRIDGPAVILDSYTTIWVPPGFYVTPNNVGGFELCPM